MAKKVDRTTKYAKLVVAGKKVAGESEILACQRHLDDLRKSKKKEFDYKFHVDLAEKSISLANELTILEGDEPQQLQTYGFQDFILGSLAGWKQKRTKYNRFREAYIQLGRQNGKSFISGGIANEKAGFSEYKEGLIICAATKQDQAKIVWNEVAKFIRADEDLAELYKITESKNTITSKVTGTRIVAVGRDTKSLDGFRTILAIPDELHAHPNNQTYRLLLGGQRRVNSALLLAITTAGFDLNGFCYEQYEFCKRILKGLVIKDSQFVFITEMDPEDDIWDYKNWAKANPLLLFNRDYTINMDEVRKMSEVAIDVKEKGGSDLMDFRTKWLNQWVAWKDGALIDLDKFKLCESEMTLEDVKGKDCYLGFDLSSGGDLTSIALLFELDNGKIFIHSHSFMPELRLLEHERTDDVPYRLWANDGLLTLTTGTFGVKTDYKFIVNYLEDLIEQYGVNIIECGYDNHNASAFLADLEFIGCPLTEVLQSARSLNDATVDFQLSVKANQLLYNKENALLVWSIINAHTTKNSFGEIKVDKLSETSRIDPVDAILDAWKVYFMNKSVSEYDVNAEVDSFMSMFEKK